MERTSETYHVIVEQDPSFPPLTLSSTKFIEIWFPIFERDAEAPSCLTLMSRNNICLSRDKACCHFSGALQGLMVVLKETSRKAALRLSLYPTPLVQISTPPRALCSAKYLGCPSNHDIFLAKLNPSWNQTFGSDASTLVSCLEQLKSCHQWPLKNWSQLPTITDQSSNKTAFHSVIWNLPMLTQGCKARHS